ncbi:hypothetical protein QFC22_000442 [Naganishia vaughanmartiniae]|uniref:Uncharacterized protein n=1 Tax=Naganishia vaughanmartiniae TaxID=1424756 RepID=A0ACC2XPB4_9TREE|nr:hypothetical protein QFC22_000442 [Naganishia vaughanmartiniae]
MSFASAARVTEEEDSYDWYDWNHNYQLPTYVDPYLPFAFSSHHDRAGERAFAKVNAHSDTDNNANVLERSNSAPDFPPASTSQFPDAHPRSTHETHSTADDKLFNWSSIRSALSLESPAGAVALQGCLNPDCEGALRTVQLNATIKDWRKILHVSHEFLRSLRIAKSSMKLPDTTAPIRILHILATIQVGDTTKALGLLSRLLADLSRKTVSEHLGSLLLILQHAVIQQQSVERPGWVFAALLPLFTTRHTASWRHDESFRNAVAQAGVSITDPCLWLQKEFDKVKMTPNRVKRQTLVHATSEAIIFATMNTASPRTLKKLFTMILDLGIKPSRDTLADLSLRFAHLGLREDALKVYSDLGSAGRADKRALPQLFRMLLEINEMDEAARMLSQTSVNTDFRHFAYILDHCIQRADDDRLSKILSIHYPGVSNALSSDSTSTKLLQEEQQVLRTLFTAYVNAGDLAESDHIMQTMIALDVPLNVAEHNALLKAFAARADTDSAHRVLDHMRSASIAPDRNTYSTLMSLYVNQKDTRAVENIFDDMQKEGIVPDAVSYAVLLNAYLEAGDWSQAATAWREFPTEVQVDKSIANTLMKGMVLLSAPFQEVYRMFASVFPDPSKADVRTWVTLIQSACDGGYLPRARELFGDFMYFTKQERSELRVNHYMVSVLVIGHIRHGEISMAKEIHDEMEKEGVMNTSVTYAAIIDAALKGQWPMSVARAKELAHRLLEEATTIQREPWKGRGHPVENIIGPLIRSAVKVGDTAEVERYFKLAMKRGIQPSIPLYTMLMDAYRHAGEYDRVQQVWEGIYALATEQMNKSSADDPSPTANRQDRRLCISLSVYIEAMSSAGRHQDVLRVWSELHENGFGFDAHNWNHLAIALTRSGDILRAFRIVENVLIKREEEVQARRYFGMRSESDPEPTVQIDLAGEDDTSALQEHLILDPAQRPPNRRHDFRNDVDSYRVVRQERSFDLDPPLDTPPSSFDPNIFTRWRPSDIMWRPTYLTIAILERAYMHLQNGRSVLGLIAGEEEDPDVREDPGASLNQSSSSAAQSRKGTPMAILTKINRKYAKTVSLIMLHRRKRKDELIRKKAKKNTV